MWIRVGAITRVFVAVGFLLWVLVGVPRVLQTSFSASLVYVLWPGVPGLGSGYLFP